MKYLLIVEDQVAGESDSEENLPNGWQAIASSIPMEKAYYKDGELKEIPPQPSEQHYWINNEWVLLTIEQPVVLNRTGFLLAIIQTSAYDHLKECAITLGGALATEYQVLGLLINSGSDRIPDANFSALLNKALHTSQQLLTEKEFPWLDKDVEEINELLSKELGVDWTL